MYALVEEALEIMQSDGSRESNANHAEGKFVDRGQNEPGEKQDEYEEACGVSNWHCKIDQWHTITGRGYCRGPADRFRSQIRRIPRQSFLC